MSRATSLYVVTTLALVTASPAGAKRQRAADIALETWAFEFWIESNDLSTDQLDERYRKACKRGYRPACDPTAWCSAGVSDLTRAGEFAIPLCEAGDHHACVLASWAVTRSPDWPVKDRLDDGIEPLEMACDAGLDRGCLELARLLWSPDVAERRDPDRAQRLFIGLCVGDWSSACNTLGEIAEAKKPIASSSRGPSHWFEKACALGHPTACSDAARHLASHGEMQAAVQHMERAVQLSEELWGPGHPETAVAVLDLAWDLSEVGEYERARALAEHALSVLESSDDSYLPDTAGCLGVLATVLAETGDYHLALPHFERALSINQHLYGEDAPETVLSLNNLALLLHMLGSDERALYLQRQAMEIIEGSEQPLTEHLAILLNNMALVTWQVDSAEAALPLFERSLEFHQRLLGPDHPTTAANLSNVALIHRQLGEPDIAIPLQEQALATRTSILGPDHPETARSLYNLAADHAALGDHDAAQELYRRALTIGLEGDFPELVWGVAGGLSELAEELDLREEAIFWGKFAVNEIRGTRASMTAFDPDLGRTFLESNEAYYRDLARLLLDAGRLAEAEQVLRLLKEEEFDGFLRRDALTDADRETVSYDAVEKDWASRVGEFRESAVVAATEYRGLQQQRRDGIELRRRELARLDELADRLSRERRAFHDRLEQIRTSFMDAPPERILDLGAMGLDRLQGLQGTLRELGTGTVLISTVVAEDALFVLLTTSNVQVAREIPVHREELDRSILELRAALTSPAVDPRPSGQKLYDILIRPVEDLLVQAEASFLMVSLDANLRYVPLAALHDGERWLLERWPTAVFTPAAEADLQVRFDGEPFVGALGVSSGGVVQGQPFPSLPAVPRELDSIVLSGSDDELGVVPGELYLDGAFSSQQLSDVLATGTPWVHLASHFHFRPGVDANSYLLLGNDEKLSLADLRYGDFPLTDVDQLTLSACETAMGTRGADGREVEGLAVLAQNLGARAVLATLWSVADDSTATWMSEMYRLRAQDGLSKAEAVRQTQLKFISGEFAPAGEGDADRGATRPDRPDDDLPEDLQGWRHPFYWAPYILMGNWR